MKIVLFANTDWYLYNYRLMLAAKLRSENHDVLLVSPKGKYSAKFTQAGFNWQEFPLSRKGINPLSEIDTIRRLSILYRKERPDVVHHFTIKCVLYGSIAAGRTGVQTIVNSITGKGILFSRQTFFTRIIRPLVKFLYKLSLRNTKVIFQNQTDMDYFLGRNLVKPEQTELIPGSGVDIERFKPSPFPAGVPLVILPARMLWAKGVFDFVEASRIVAASGQEVRFALVGEPDHGNPDSVSSQKLKEWQHKGWVEWWGWQEDMASVYQAASIVCLPSFYGEGLAKSLIEAAASGRPLIASDIPGCREVVLDGVNGYLIPARQPQRLAEAVLDILSDRDRKKNMGIESRKLVESQFSSDIIICRTLKTYNDI